MIIIDQDTNIKLAAALEKLKTTAENARCIYFNLKSLQHVEAGVMDQVISSTKLHIATIDTQVYLCGDGDIFILAPSIDSKNARKCMLDTATFLKIPVAEEWVRFVELPLYLHQLFAEVDAKLAKDRKIQEAKQKLLELQQAERKRNAILNGGAYAKQDEIKNRRDNRKTTEIMIIEDDVFSRKLVENTLQKKYPLTGLGEASHALDTYASIAPDLLFLDINLPDVTGHELLEKIIKLDPDAYVIMLSGNCDRENITQAMSKEAKGFVAKPFTKDKLFQYIERCPTIALKQNSNNSQ